MPDMTSVWKFDDCSGNMPRSMTSACARMTAFVIPEQEWNTLSAMFVTLAGTRMLLIHPLPLNADEPTAVTGYDLPPDSTDDGSTRSSGPVPEYPVRVASPSATVNDQGPSVKACNARQNVNDKQNAIFLFMAM